MLEGGLFNNTYCYLNIDTINAMIEIIVGIINFFEYPQTTG